MEDAAIPCDDRQQHKLRRSASALNMDRRGPEIYNKTTTIPFHYAHRIGRGMCRRQCFMYFDC